MYADLLAHLSAAMQAERGTSVAAAHASQKVMQRRAMSGARNPLSSGKRERRLAVKVRVYDARDRECVR